MPSKANFLSLLLLLSALFLVPNSVMAQDASAEPSAASEPAKVETVGDALKAFFEAFPDPRTGSRDTIARDAVPRMEFEGPLGLLSDAEKETFAYRLKSVIDRLRFVDLNEVTREAANARVYTLATTPSGYDVRLRLNERGQWVFTADTVDRINLMLTDVRNIAPIEGVIPIKESDISLGSQIEKYVPENMKQQFLVLRIWQWIGLFVLIALGVLADRVMTFLALLFSNRFIGKAALELDEGERKAVLRPYGLLAMGAVWWIGISALNLPTTTYAILLVAVKFIIGLSFVWGAIKAVDVATAVLIRRARASSTRYDELVIPFMNRVIKIFVFVFGVVFVAQNIGVDMTSLIAGLGIGGLAFALAAKDTVENVFGSLTVMIDRPFRVGDWIALDNGIEGTVETVGLRSTRIRTFYNSLITLPNAKLISSPVDNFGARRFRRWRTMLSVTYDTPPEKIDAFCEGLRELVRRHPYTTKHNFHIYANEFNSASLDILVYIFFETPDWATELRERHRFFLDILRLARELGVEFAFPTQTLHIVKDLPTHQDAPPNTQEAERRGAKAAAEILTRQYGKDIPKFPPAQYLPGPRAIDDGGEQSEQGLS